MTPDAGDRGTRVIVLEGVPGSGKTATAQWLARRFELRGHRVELSEELRRDHPVIPRALKKTSREPGYADRCIAGWRSFADALAKDDRATIQILEGCLFQSTVRFLLEHDHPREAPGYYMEETARALAPFAPRLVYLTQPDPRAFMRANLAARKGARVVAKIAGYTETTACSRAHRWTGFDGMVEFYAHYRDVCDALVGQQMIPHVEIDTSTGDWDEVRRRADRWISQGEPPIA